MKLIQVGLGGFANTWIPAVLNTPEVEYSGFVEINPAIAEAQAVRYGLDPARIFPTLAEALAAVPADGVINVTPPRVHRDISVVALRAGVPVISEKPLAATMDEARDIVRVSNETGVLHVVAQNYRYSAQAQTIRQVLTSGELGAVGAVAVQFFRGPHFGGFRDEMAYPLVIDMSIHHFDMMRFFLGADPLSIAGRSWSPAWSWYRGDASIALTVEFPGDVFVTYDGSWCSQGQETPWNAHWRFECERGVLTLHEDRLYAQTFAGVDPGTGYRQAQHSPLREIDLTPMPYQAQQYLLREFHAAVTQGAPFVTTCHDNIKSLALVFGAVQSFETGNRVQIADLVNDSRL